MLGNFKIAATVATLVMSSGLGASASTVDILVDFDSGALVGNTYVEDGFTFTTTRNGGVSLSSDCGSKCLQLNNDEIVTVTYKNGAFDLLGFSFRGPGGGGDMFISSNVGGSQQTITESLNGNDLQPISLNVFGGILSFNWQNARNGSGRVDDIRFTVPAPVPLPAAGLMLLAGIGGLAAMARRRRRLN